MMVEGMNKLEFLQTYGDKLTIWFDYAEFERDDAFTVAEGRVSLDGLGTYFVPRYKKHGVCDNRSIEEQFDDEDVLPVTAAEASADPEKWNLGLGARPLSTVDALWPIPVAIDIETGHALILDSNHSVVNLLCARELGANPEVALAQVSGPHLERLIADFAVLNRHVVNLQGV